MGYVKTYLIKIITFSLPALPPLLFINMYLGERISKKLFSHDLIHNSASFIIKGVFVILVLILRNTPVF